MTKNIDTEAWTQQDSSLRKINDSVQAATGAAYATMGGNPYGLLLTPLFAGTYESLRMEFTSTNSAVGDTLERYADALKQGARDIEETEQTATTTFTTTEEHLR